MFEAATRAMGLRQYFETSTNLQNNSNELNHQDLCFKQRTVNSEVLRVKQGDTAHDLWRADPISYMMMMLR